MPTRKWWAAFGAGVIGLAVMLITGDSEVTDPEKVAIGAFLSERLVAWLVPNEPGKSGLPADPGQPDIRGSRGQVSDGLIAALALVAIAVILAIALL